MNKQLILIVISLLLFNHVSVAQKNRLTSVKIEWEDFITSTVINVEPDAFYKIFKKTIRTKKINGVNEMIELERMTKTFIGVEPEEIDVRGVITFSYGKKNVKYFFDQFGLFTKDKKFYHCKRLAAFIEKKLYPKGFY